MRSTTELREQILAAARAEFAGYGLAGSRIDRIAKNAQASKERLYAHFGDKDALFREVLAVDAQTYFSAVRVDPERVAEFVGEIYDLARSHPELLRMITWARLEGLSLLDPRDDADSAPAQAVARIEEAQAAGRVDGAWVPADLLALLLATGLAWAQSPHPDARTDDPAVVAARRAAAVEAAERIVAPRPGAAVVSPAGSTSPGRPHSASRRRHRP